jgi:hypothetical protein
LELIATKLEKEGLKQYKKIKKEKKKKTVSY